MQMTLLQFADRYYNYVFIEKGYSLNTLIEYKRDVGNFIDFLEKLNICDAASITRDLIVQYKVQLHKKNNSNRTQFRKLNSIQLYLKYIAIYWDQVDKSNLIILPKFEKKLPEHFSEQQIKKIINSLKVDTYYDLRLNTIFKLLYGSGIRISELCNLTFKDVYMDERIIKIKGKGNKERLVPLHRHICELIELLYKHPDKPPSQYVFVSNHHNKIKKFTRQGIWYLLKQLGKQINLSLNPHKLRHSFASHLLQNGANLRYIQLLLGHSSISTTEIYTHIETKQLRKIYDKYHPRA